MGIGSWELEIVELLDYTINRSLKAPKHRSVETSWSRHLLLFNDDVDDFAGDNDDFDDGLAFKPACGGGIGESSGLHFVRWGVRAHLYVEAGFTVE